MIPGCFDDLSGRRASRRPLFLIMDQSFVSEPRQGYFLQPFDGRVASLVHHVLGGPNRWESRCPRCDQTLVMILQLDPRDTRLGLKGIPSPRLPLMCCPGCFSARLDYCFTSAGELLVSERNERAAEGGAPTDRMEPPPEEKILLHAIPDRIVEARLLASEGRLVEAQDWAGR